MKETIRKKAVNGCVCPRGPSKRDECFGYLSNPIVPRGHWHQGTGLLGLLSQCSYNVKLPQNMYMLAFSLKQKLAGLYFHCTDKCCLNAVKAVDCEL